MCNKGNLRLHKSKTTLYPISRQPATKLCEHLSLFSWLWGISKTGVSPTPPAPPLLILSHPFLQIDFYFQPPLCSGNTPLSFPTMSEEPNAQRRRVEDAPPSWALPIRSLADALPRLSDDVRQLKEQFAALSLASPQPPPAVYPTVVCAQALDDLAKDPRTHTPSRGTIPRCPGRDLPFDARRSTPGFCSASLRPRSTAPPTPPRRSQQVVHLLGPEAIPQ